MVVFCTIGESAYREDHHVDTCDGCATSGIEGNCYNCLSCPTTLCETCYETSNYGQKSTVHDSFHACRVTPCPLDRLSLPQHPFDCNGCQSRRFLGLALQCETCSNYNLCLRCYENGNYAPKADTITEHHADHPMKEIEPTEIKRDTELRMQAWAFRYQQTMGEKCLRSRSKDFIGTNFGRRIGYFLYGPPTINAEESDVSKYGYEPEKEEKILGMMKHCYKLNPMHEKEETVEISFIYINFYGKDGLEGVSPLLKVYTASETFFVERSMRTYKGWQDFVENNEFPECTLICPKAGEYTFEKPGKFFLELRESATCKLVKQVVKKADVVATGGAILGTGLGLVSLFTPLAPIAAGALLVTSVTTGSWFAGRSVGNLADRGLHKQTINPLDKEAFFDWFSLTATAVSFGSMRAVSWLAKSASQGAQVGRTASVFTNCLIFGSLGFNGVGCGIQAFRFADSLKNGDKIDPLQVFQLTAQILFFTNAVISVKHATRIIKDVQNGHLDQARNLLATEEERVQFDKTISNNKQRFGEVKGGQMVLEDLRSAQPAEVVPSSQKINKGAQRHAARPTIEEGFSRSTIESKAISKADQARGARYGGRQANQRSVTTVLTMDPVELQNRVLANAKPEQLHGRHNVQLKGTFQAPNVHYDPLTGTNEVRYVEIKNPTFGVTNGKVTHFNVHKAGRVVEISAQQYQSQYRHVDTFTAFQNQTFALMANKDDEEKKKK